MKVNVYLYFPGTCEEAFKHYESVLGGKIEATHRYDEAPPEMTPPPGWEKKIMHVSLNVGSACIMGSDLWDEHFTKPQGYSVSLQIEEPEEAERLFAALLEGGNATMPIGETFWARRFGTLTDRFGIDWMVNCE